MISGPIPAGSPKVMPISGRGDGCFMSIVLSLGLDDIKLWAIYYWKKKE